MLKWILDHFKIIALIGIIIIAMEVLGAFFSSIIPWDWLTSFFSLMKWALNLVDFFVDTDTLITVIGLVLSIEGAYWAFKGIMLVVHWFRPR